MLLTAYIIVLIALLTAGLALGLALYSARLLLVYKALFVDNTKKSHQGGAN